jgi:hypothetical protein
MIKKIKGCPHYGITDDGKVFSLYLKRQIFPWVTNEGYLMIELKENGERIDKTIHRLVAEAFIPNPNKFPVINHIDEIKTNNNMNNLEWCTVKYNNHYGANPNVNNIKKAQEARKRRVVQMLLDGTVIKEYESLKEAAEKTGVHRPNISHCVAGKRKKAGGYRWAYK